MQKNQALCPVRCGSPPGPFSRKRRRSGAKTAYTAMNTTKNPAKASHISVPLRRRSTSTASPIPNETKNSTTAQSALGQRLAWQCGQTTVESPERVQSDFAGTCRWHCGQVMVRYLPKAGTLEGASWRLPPPGNRGLIYHNFRPAQVRAAIRRPPASHYLDLGVWHFRAGLEGDLTRGLFILWKHESPWLSGISCLEYKMIPPATRSRVRFGASARITGAS
jgi:hypothetical protein